jgi:two-component system CheB/CheR fusion protein
MQPDHDPSRALLDAAPVGIWVTARGGRILDVNPAACEMLGHRREDLVGRSILELSHPADVIHRARDVDAPAGGVIVSRRRLRTAEGGWILVEGRARILADGRIVTVVHDVTELERAERARAESEREFRGIFELALSGKASADPATGQLLRVNRKLCEITGYSEEELLARTFADITYPDDRARASAELEKVRTGGASGWTLEQRYLRKNGSVAWVVVTGTMLRDEDGRATRAFATIHDITDRKEMEAALRDADRRKDEFLAMLSHELRNPLAPMRNGLAVLALAPPASDEARRARAALERQVAHLSRLVDDLLDLTRISRGKIELRRAPVDLADVAVRTAEDHRGLLAAAGIALELRAPAGPVPVDGDAVRLAQVLGNLLHNAAKFTPSGGRVWVELEADRAAAAAALRVRDDGVGIPADVLPRLFEPFAQADATLARTRGGLGIGLALVRRLVELHGGTVSVRSDGAGRGTEFTLHLPLAERAAAPGPAPAVPERAGALRVLVVDDNADAADTLRDLLEMSGHVATVARDGAEALALARTFWPDAVLCDIGLPGLDGYAVAKTLRADPALAEVFLVALTGYALPDDLRRTAEAGFDAHLAKPPPLETIEALLRHARRAGGDARPGDAAAADAARDVSRLPST